MRNYKMRGIFFYLALILFSGCAGIRGDYKTSEVVNKPLIGNYIIRGSYGQVKTIEFKPGETVLGIIIDKNDEEIKIGKDKNGKISIQKEESGDEKNEDMEIEVFKCNIENDRLFAYNIYSGEKEYEAIIYKGSDSSWNRFIVSRNGDRDMLFIKDDGKKLFFEMMSANPPRLLMDHLELFLSLSRSNNPSEQSLFYDMMFGPEYSKEQFLKDMTIKESKVYEYIEKIRDFEPTHLTKYLTEAGIRFTIRSEQEAKCSIIDLKYQNGKWLFSEVKDCEGEC